MMIKATTPIIWESCTLVVDYMPFNPCHLHSKGARLKQVPIATIQNQGKPLSAYQTHSLDGQEAQHQFHSSSSPVSH